MAYTHHTAHTHITHHTYHTWHAHTHELTYHTRAYTSHTHTHTHTHSKHGLPVITKSKAYFISNLVLGFFFLLTRLWKG